MKLTAEQLEQVYEIIEEDEYLDELLEEKYARGEEVYSILCQIAKDYNIA